MSEEDYFSDTYDYFEDEDIDIEIENSSSKKLLSISECFFKGWFCDTPNMVRLDVNDLLCKRDNIIMKVQDKLKVSYEKAIEILKEERWDIGFLFLDNTALDSNVFAETLNIDDFNIKYDGGECPVCSYTSMLYHFDCEHSFCSKCWINYLTVRFKDYGVEKITCMENDCSFQIPHKSILFLVNKDYDKATVKAKKLYIDKISYQYSLESNNIKRCPNEKCNNFIEYKLGILTSLECSCGSLFCKKCSQPFHYPLKCGMLDVFFDEVMTKYENSEEYYKTIQVVMETTKPCPKCSYDIEKISGCDHILCSRCGTLFCWNCLIDLPVRGYMHQCLPIPRGLNQERNKSLMKKYTPILVGENKKMYLEKYNNIKRSKFEAKELIKSKEILLKIFENCKSGFEELCKLIEFSRNIEMNMVVFEYFCLDKEGKLKFLQFKCESLQIVTNEVLKFVHEFNMKSDPNLIAIVFDQKLKVLFRAIGVLFEECEISYKKGIVKFNREFNGY